MRLSGCLLHGLLLGLRPRWPELVAFRAGLELSSSDGLDLKLPQNRDAISPVRDAGLLDAQRCGRFGRTTEVAKHLIFLHVPDYSARYVVGQ